MNKAIIARLTGLHWDSRSKSLYFRVDQLPKHLSSRDTDYFQLESRKMIRTKPAPCDWATEHMHRQHRFHWMEAYYVLLLLLVSLGDNNPSKTVKRVSTYQLAMFEWVPRDLSHNRATPYWAKCSLPRHRTKKLSALRSGWFQRQILARPSPRYTFGYTTEDVHCPVLFRRTSSVTSHVYIRKGNGFPCLKSLPFITALWR